MAQSGKLSSDTLFQCDNDDLMAKMWELTKEKDKIQEEIDQTTMEIDGWLQILHCSTAAELEQLMDDFSSNPSILPPSFTILHPAMGREKVDQYCSVISRLSVHEIMDCAQAYDTKEGELFIKFPWRPPNKPGHECLALLKPGPEHTYSVSSHNLPSTVPLESLEKKYLQKPQGPEGLRKFVAVVGQHTKALYSRLQQIMALENSKTLEGTSVRHNTSATAMSFVVNVKQREQSKISAEFVLKFDPLDLLPHTVTASPVILTGKEKVPSTLQAALDKVAERMKATPFPQVMLMEQARAFASSQEQQQRTGPSSPTTSLDIDDSDPLFDLGE